MSIFAYLKNAQIVHTTQKCMITHRFITIILIIKCPPKAEARGSNPLGCAIQLIDI